MQWTENSGIFLKKSSWICDEILTFYKNVRGLKIISTAVFRRIHTEMVCIVIRDTDFGSEFVYYS